MAEEYYQGSQGAGSFVEKHRLFLHFDYFVKIVVGWKFVAKEEGISIFSENR